jgi:hypothetical protein
MVSGPGKFSQRTDGQPGSQPVRSLPDAGYGEQAEFRGLQQSAPLAATQGSPVPQGAPGAAPQAPSPVPLTEGTQRPQEPVTHGIDAGAGAGPEVLGNPDSRPADAARLSDWLPMLVPHSRNPDSSDAFRALVRFISNSHAQTTMDGDV